MFMYIYKTFYLLEQKEIFDVLLLLHVHVHIQNLLLTCTKGDLCCIIIVLFSVFSYTEIDIKKKSKLVRFAFCIILQYLSTMSLSIAMYKILY